MSPRRRNLPTLANVKGQYLLPDNTPDRGAVSFRVYDPAVYDSEVDPNTVTEAPVVAPLDGTGAFSADLAASADEGWRLDEASMTAGGMPYVITINTQGLRDSYVAYVPEGDSRLEDLVVLDWDPDVILTPGSQGDAATVDVGTTTTGDAGTDAAVVNSGSTSAAVFDFTIPKGDQGDQGEVSQAELEAYAAQRATVGNLLTDNQASVETDLTGLSSSGGTLTRDTGNAYHGSACASAAWAGNGSLLIGSTGTNGVPVVAGQAYTVSARAKHSIGTQPFTYIVTWYDGAGNALTAPTIATVTVGTDWTLITGTLVAPASAAYARPYLYQSGGAGHTTKFDCLGFWAGAGGNWAMPGTPIPGLGTRITRPNLDDRLAETWNGSAWSVVDYNSGWRALTVDTGVMTQGSVYMRRKDNIVYLAIGPSSSYTVASSGTISTIPSGFRLDSLTNLLALVPRVGTTDWYQCTVIGSSQSLTTRTQTGATFASSINLYVVFPQWYTDDPIPTSLPGTLVTPAPQ